MPRSGLRFKISWSSVPQGQSESFIQITALIQQLDGLCQSFKILSKLPLELRLKIQKYYPSFEEERLIQLQYAAGSAIDTVGIHQYHHDHFRALLKSRIPPIIFLIYRETRSAYLKTYMKVCFDSLQHGKE
jgi:hypothetical protein